MKIYSKLKINLISIIVSTIICFFIMEYIPKIYNVSKTYFYYKSQPDLIEEYEQ